MSTSAPRNGAPKLSVLLPVYNAECYVTEAIESVLSQSFEDFELIIVDDGSTDGSAAILDRFAARDTRIRLIRRPNTGLVGALNDGLSRACGSLLARMDADDISLPARFEQQVRFLDDHPEVHAVGTRVLFTDPVGRPLRPMVDLYRHDEIEELLLRGGQAMVGAATTMRRESVIAAGCYRERFDTLEDLDLLLRIAEIGRLANLADVLYLYRQGFERICHRRSSDQRYVAEQLLKEAHRRRGLPFQKEAVLCGSATSSVISEHRKWAWWALGAGYLQSARKHAWATFWRAPLSSSSWRVLLCAMRGY